MNRKEMNGISILEVQGEIDANTAPDLLKEVEPMIAPSGKILLDLSGVTFMSSAGLRTMVVIYRQVAGNKGKIGLTGLSEDVEDTMAATGFLRFFSVFETAEAAMEGLK
jgi:anti-sigma B factor antagonist